jgi:predicted DNA-binding transcriptional regulator YafY
MARNSEVIRQWEILREIDGARVGLTIAKLAGSRGVHQRTIRRDVDALSAAGFPLYDDKINGSTVWKLKTKPFRALEETGLSLIELCALYFSRTLLTTVAGVPLGEDAERAFIKIERALPASCRKFLDGLPVAIQAKFAGRKKNDDRKVREVVVRATEAMLNHRRVTMRYDSAASRRTKEYLVEPLRMSYAGGGTYLTAFVPEYGEMRNFAVERIHALATTDETFAPRPLPAEPFANSIGVYSGTPERVELEFDASIADYVTGREWNKTQTFEKRPDGSIAMRLDVCVDLPLRAWILSFGAAVRVVAPPRLAAGVLDQLEQARTRYMPRLSFEMLSMAPAESAADRPTVPMPMKRLWRAS